ncbi:MAG: zinc ribbon domain-containing protein [Planctomycetota bacterium]
MLSTSTGGLASLEVALVFLVVTLGLVISAGWLAIWLVMMLVRGTVNLGLVLAGKPTLGSRRRRQGLAGAPCPDPMCRRVNPPAAAFCRQCGRALVMREKQASEGWDEARHGRRV